MIINREANDNSSYGNRDASGLFPRKLQHCTDKTCALFLLKYYALVIFFIYHRPNQILHGTCNAPEEWNITH